MDTASQWPQDVVLKPMEEIATFPKPCSVERKVRPHKEQALNCPRCNSTNTKFCYYNNYSLSQPRYFCKTCRRYWTEGGSLRSIPVGGGSRKNKRSSSSSSNHTSSNSSSKKLPDLVSPQQQQNPKTYNNILETGQDLNLGFSIHHQNHHHADLKTITEMIKVPNFQNNTSFSGGIRTREREQGSSSSLELQNPNSSLELLTAGLSTTTATTTSRGFNSYTFMPLPVVNTSASAADFGSGFPNLPEFKFSSLNFSLDHGLGNNYGSFQGVHETNEDNKLLFPFEDLKQDHSSNTNINDDGDQQIRDSHNGDPSAGGYWNGVIGGGSW